MLVINEKKIEVLFDEDSIAKRNKALAKEIAAANPQNLLILSVLKGSFVFAADLIRALYHVGIGADVEFIKISSYGAGQKSGMIRLVQDIEDQIEGRDILLLDDILESGKTLEFVSKHLALHKPKKVAIATLLDKSQHRNAAIKADYVGFSCPDKFVFGYGIDAGHAFRELPFIAAFKQ